MEQYTDSQYDDDLTIGMEDTDESFDTAFVDLFEHSGDDESPISRLKTIVLSIDWEINDEVLTQFNDELVDLKDIWADDEIKLVYVQALEKISKYIYQQKSDAHPNAIKLLLTFYYNLEKIVIDESLSEEEKKNILRADVKKFEQLKQQIGSSGAEQTQSQEKTNVLDSASPATINEQGEAHPTLFNLKACILGMDWEITERELGDLSNEIKNLESKFASSKPKMLFLQGINALGGYIKLKKSNAHADAFKLLYSFYEGLEKIVSEDMTLQEEKKVLLPEVEKFELFKKTIATTITPEALGDEDKGEIEQYPEEDDSVAPAFADISDEVHGFQAEEEAATLQSAGNDDVEGRLDSFFGEEEPSPAKVIEDTVIDNKATADDERAVTPAGEELPREAQDKIDSFFDENDASDNGLSISAEEALKGVDVETEADDDSDEEALPVQGDGLLAPALADSGDEEEHGFNPELSESAGAESPTNELTGTEAELDDRVGAIFGDQDSVDTGDSIAALDGVNVETEADDDSDEAPLPVLDDEIAPALFDGDDDDEERISDFGESLEIDEQVAGFFADEEEVPAETSVETAEDVEDTPDALFDDGVLEEDAVPAALTEIESGSDSATDEFFADSGGDEEGETSAEVELSLDSDAVTEIEGGVDSFFDEGEEGEEMFRPAPDDEIIASTDGLPQDEETTFDSTEDAAEDAEITFEAVDDIDEDEEEDIPVAVLEEDVPVDDELSSFGSGTDEKDFFAAIDDRVDEPGEFQMEILDESDDFESEAVAVAVDEEPQEDDEEEITPAIDVQTATEDEEVPTEEEVYTFASDDSLSDLRAGIASLGVEINDSIIDAILKEINGLRHKMITRPVEKTFLQLLSTIIQHIGQYRYEASADAHGLMLSVFDKLELVQNGETSAEDSQEILLAETSKVLLWQQKMLDRQAVRKGEQLTFIDPVRTAEGDTEDVTPEVGGGEETLAGSHGSSVSSDMSEEQDFSAVFEPVVEEESEESLSFEENIDEPVELADDEHDDLAKELEDELSKDLFEEDELDSSSSFIDESDESFGEELDLPSELDDDEHGLAVTDQEDSEEAIALADNENIAVYVKKEIEALRESLQEEIRQLKNKLEEKKE